MSRDQSTVQTASEPAAGRRRTWRRATWVAAVFVGLVYLGNTSRFVAPLGTEPYLIAHRGVAQQFSREGLTASTCTAERMLPPEHGYLENTLASIQAAFDFGADAVEIDVQRTTDDRFAVFHDWTLDCRTDGEGVTREHALAELQTLDVGYGYTADGGATFPFRGRGVGQLPSLEQVLTAFPERDLVLDAKGADADEARLLAERLAALTADRPGKIIVYGGPPAVAVIQERLPDIVSITRPRLKRCLLRYLALGWTSHVPAACARGMIAVPANVAPWLWGWPNRFLRRMDSVGSRVVLIGDYQGGSLSQGFDDPDRFHDLPSDYAGGVWTDRIDLLGPAAGRTPPDAAETGTAVVRFEGRFLHAGLPEETTTAIPIGAAFEREFVVSVEVAEVVEGELPDGWSNHIVFAIHSPAQFFGLHGLTLPEGETVPEGRYLFFLRRQADRGYDLDVEAIGTR